MKVSTQRLPESQVLLEIEVEAEQMERSLERAYRKLVQRVAVPGFRKGKTPRPMLERHLGRPRLVQEALDILIPEAYNRALDEQQIEAIGQPIIELVAEEPLAFRATVPVRPTVELGDYHSLRVERLAVTVDPQEVDAALEELRHRYAVHEPVERAVQMGDIVRAEVRGVIDGQQVFSDDDAEFRLREGAVVLMPGFAEGLVGAEKGVPREVTVTIPDDWPNFAGKSGTFTVTVKEVKEERLPELNDQFARDVGEGFPTLLALRERLTADLRERLEAQAEEEYRNKAVDALVEQAQKIEFPPVLVEREVDRLLQDQSHAVGHDLERYLEMTRRSLEELREEFRPAALERLRRSLALTRLAEAEGITVAPADIDAEIERLAGSAGPQGTQIRQLFGSAQGREAIERSLLTRRTVDRLVEIVGQGADAGEPAPTESVEAQKETKEEP